MIDPSYSFILLVLLMWVFFCTFSSPRSLFFYSIELFRFLLSQANLFYIPASLYILIINLYSSSQPIFLISDPKNLLYLSLGHFYLFHFFTIKLLIAPSTFLNHSFLCLNFLFLVLSVYSHPSAFFQLLNTISESSKSFYGIHHIQLLILKSSYSIDFLLTIYLQIHYQRYLLLHYRTLIEIDLHLPSSLLSY